MEERDPANLKLKNEVGTNIVIESTGQFLTKETCQKQRQESDPERPLQRQYPDVRLWYE